MGQYQLFLDFQKFRGHQFQRVCTLAVFFMTISGQGQHVWDADTYPDNNGFEQRMKPMVQRIADQGFGTRSLARSKCPDTGLPVETWAVKGERVISPYTGRTYLQGETGYFGPKARNDKGEIIAFGGDPLKKDLPPATAALLKDPENIVAKAYLSIPGNLRQQYHFAAKNWARFYPLLQREMGEEWKKKFHHWVGNYKETVRPSDGYRKNAPLSKPHDLVGEPRELLGGNPKDGGTENHKTMWRTSALLYSQLFPDYAEISGYPSREAESLTKEMLRDYMKRILKTGNGEYDSQVYYPHSIEGFLNLYDFSPDEETRQLAKFMLDYYFVTYGLKVVDGAIAGAQKRGYLPSSNPSEMEIMQWGFFDDTSRDMTEVHSTVHQATTTYRPNKIIYDIVRKNIALPFESRMSRPFYHMDRAHAFAETFYASDSYALGSVQMTIVDNPNQQMVWSLIAKGANGPLAFSGGHPMRGSTSGHSPYTQVLQSRGTLALVTAPTLILEEVDTLIAPVYSKTDRANLWHLPNEEHGEMFEVRNRQKYGRAPLKQMSPLRDKSAKAYEDFWNENQKSACSWLYYPKSLTAEKFRGNWFFEAKDTFISVIPLTDTSNNIAPNETLREELKGSAGNFFKDYNILVFPGQKSGYIVETGERSKYRSMAQFKRAITKNTAVDKNVFQEQLVLNYKTIDGDNLKMEYLPFSLRCAGWINDKKLDWDDFTNSAVYDSPYVKVKNGTIWINNGTKGYTVEFKKDRPVWKDYKVLP